MLTDQTFQPAPVIIVGPELFYHASARPQGLDMAAIMRIRKAQATALWKLTYLSMYDTPPIPRDFHVVLGNVGIRFNSHTIVNPANPVSVRAGKFLAVFGEMLYSPNFSAKVLTSRKHDVAQLPREAVVDALVDLAQPDFDGVFKPGFIYQYTLRKWQTGN